MRRFASIFTSKRDKPGTGTSTDTSTRSQSHISLTVNNLKRVHAADDSPAIIASPTSINDYSIPPTPQLSAHSAQSQSSASSSGSASLQTPEDLPRPVGTPTRRKSWARWMGGRSSTTKREEQSPQQVRPKPKEWRPHPPPLLRPPPTGNRSTKPADETEDEETSSESEDDDESADESVPQIVPTRAIVPPIAIAQPAQTLQVLIQNSLRHRTSHAPLVLRPGEPLYPRSCNPSRLLPHQETLHSSMHKKRLLRRLQDIKMPLTHIEETSILPFSSQPIPTLIPSACLSTDETAPSKDSTPSHFSTGLHRWLHRPCFEERYSVWVVVDGKVTCQAVSGTKLGVAELEYSEALEAMVDFTVPPPPPPQRKLEEVWTPEELDTPASDAPPPSPPSPSSNSTNLSASQARNAPYIAVPSPLRNQHNPVAISPAPSIGGHAAGPSTPVMTSVAPPTTQVKRGVRFAEDDKEDTIPIGYVLRIKKQREERAKFLREEKERRLFEEERARIEAERQKMEQERNEWEKERRAWEKEKRAVEEERKQRLYAEELAASRSRRETQRAGGATRGTLGTSSSSTSLPDSERNKREANRYSRPLYDAPQLPRNQASDSGAALSPSPNNSSPSSSRPSSIVGHSPVVQSGNLTPPHPSSRTPSMYSSHTLSSSEDVRLRRESLGKRNSLASVSSGRPPNDRAASLPNWSSSNASLIIPSPVVMPYQMDLPLLPPTAPFMMNQYPRQRSKQSVSPGPSNNSSSPTRHRPPSNHSSERIHERPSSYRHDSSPQRREHSSSPSTQSSSPHRTHERRSSGDTGRSNTSHGQDRGRPPPSSHRSQPNTLSRGRPPVPHSSSLQSLHDSPWTALPTQHGRPPSSMPQHAGTNSSLRAHPSRRQTTVS